MKKVSKQICIGERIKEIFDKSNMSITQFANQLHCDRTNAYNIFRRKKIDITLLLEISKILNHDFIDEICINHGFAKDQPSSKISLVLEINNIDAKVLNSFVKSINKMEITTIREIKS